VEDLDSKSDVDKLCSLLKSVASEVAWIEHLLSQENQNISQLRDDFKSKELDILACLKQHQVLLTRLFPA
jgi:hypothetical protein